MVFVMSYTLLLPAGKYETLTFFYFFSPHSWPAPSKGVTESSCISVAQVGDTDTADRPAPSAGPSRTPSRSSTRTRPRFPAPLKGISSAVEGGPELPASERGGKTGPGARSSCRHSGLSADARSRGAHGFVTTPCLDLPRPDKGSKQGTQRKGQSGTAHGHLVTNCNEVTI